MVDYDLGKVVGDKGETGNGISSIRKTGTSGKVDTYTITYTDGTTSTFTVTNGSDASVTIDSVLSSSSTNPVQNKVIKSALDNKANSSHTHTESDISDLRDYIEKSSTSGLVKNDGSIDTNTYLTSHQDITGKCDKSNGANQLTDSSAYAYLGTSANATQKTINQAINDKIGSAIAYINQ